MAGDDNVVTLESVTSLDLDADRVLLAAAESDLKSVVILGYTQDGKEYFASSIADGGEVNWLIDRCKMRLLRAADDIEERPKFDQPAKILATPYANKESEPNG